MNLVRRVRPELLDTLAADDPQAQRARRDLQRVNRAMATLTIALRAFDQATAAFPPRTILELGAGDGTLMLRLARCRAVRWPSVHVTLLDQQGLIAPETLEGFRMLGWFPEVVTTDVFDWLRLPSNHRWDIVFANLFAHHFTHDQLPGLFTGISTRCHVFVCCEPRRTALPLLGSHLLRFIGANGVTRHDAVLSVRAGFRDQELSEVWPDHRNWRLCEYAAGLFSHCFIATHTSR